MAIYLEMTSLKGVSSVKLGRDLNIRQASAWFMLHRITWPWCSRVRLEADGVSYGEATLTVALHGELGRIERLDGDLRRLFAAHDAKVIREGYGRYCQLKPGPDPAQWCLFPDFADENAYEGLSRLQVSGRSHQSRRLAVPPVHPEFSRR